LNKSVLRSTLRKPIRLDSRLWLMLRAEAAKAKAIQDALAQTEEDLRVHEEEASEAQSDLQRIELMLKEAKEKAALVQHDLEKARLFAAWEKELWPRHG
jgi:uncharacterized protein YPO0396